MYYFLLIKFVPSTDKLRCKHTFRAEDIGDESIDYFDIEKPKLEDTKSR